MSICNSSVQVKVRVKVRVKVKVRDLYMEKRFPPASETADNLEKTKDKRKPISFVRKLSLHYAASPQLVIFLIYLGQLHLPVDFLPVLLERILN